MKKLTLSFILTLTMTLSLSLALANNNPVAELTGKIWMDSSEDNKMALIYGVECAITMEYLAAKHKADQAEEKQNHEAIVAALNGFSRGWILALNEVARAEIVQLIDTWYINHQEQLNRQVFDVIWHEIIEPKLKTR